MESVLIPAAIGTLIIVLGVINLKGNIDTLHRYHRKRVREEDRLPYGRAVGTGTILVGCSLIVKACFDFASAELKMPLPESVGTIVSAVCLIAGFVIITCAMFRYNKGIF
ncbi:MAG: hypothetical protein K6G61_00990 [Solobacterium sp.]|nr:hypothetical protein [Solobacterium sp.]